MNDYLEAMADDMKGVLDALASALAKIRTGRASPKLVETVPVLVAAYGSSMPLNQLCTVNAPDARLLVLTPWDKSTIQDIERAIVAAGLGLNPSSDGQVVRLPIPPLTAERRRDLIKQVKRIGEDMKVRLRHVRREYNEMFKSAEDDGDVAEDQMHKLLAQVQDATNAHVKKIDDMLNAKEAEVSEV